MHYLGEVENI